MNEAATEYADDAAGGQPSHELYMRVLEKVEEAGLAAGVRGSNISVVDPARQPVKPVAPDLPLYMAITLFAGLWLAVGGALLLESLESIIRLVTIAALLAVLLPAPWRTRRRPRPAPRGLPTGVARIPHSQDDENPAQSQGSSRGVEQPSRRKPGRNAAHGHAQRFPQRPCLRPSPPATFSISASTTRRSFIPRCASPPRAQ